MARTDERRRAGEGRWRGRHFSSGSIKTIPRRYFSVQIPNHRKTSQSYETNLPCGLANAIGLNVALVGKPYNTPNLAMMIYHDQFIFYRIVLAQGFKLIDASTPPQYIQFALTIYRVQFIFHSHPTKMEIWADQSSNPTTTHIQEPLNTKADDVHARR